MQVPVGEELLGRVVNTLGQPIDGLGPINTTKTRSIEAGANSGVMDRKSVFEPLQTGIVRSTHLYQLAVDNGS